MRRRRPTIVRIQGQSAFSYLTSEALKIACRDQGRMASSARKLPLNLKMKPVRVSEDKSVWNTEQQSSAAWNGERGSRIGKQNNRNGCPLLPAINVIHVTARIGRTP
jgi:hypothetical protein